MSQFIFPPLTASLDSEASSGAALPSAQIIVGGYYASGTVVYPIAVDAAGQLQVDVVSSTGPTGFATSALQTTGNGILTTIDADTGSIAGAISGTEMQVDVVAALPTGSNAIGKLAANSGVDIGDVTLNAGTAAFGKLSANTGVDIGSVALLGGTNAVGTVILGAGTAEIGKLAAGTASIGVLGANSGVDIGDVTLNAGTAEIGKLAAGTAGIGSLTAGTAAIGSVTIGTSTGVDIGAVTLLAGTNEIGKLGAGTAVIGKILPNTPVDFLDAGVFDASTGTNIPAAGSAVLVTLAADCKEIEVIDDIGEYMSLRLTDGTVKAYLPLGGGRVMCSLSTGNAMKLYSETGTTISSGKIAMNFLG